MKQIIVDNISTNYYITEDGRCYNSKTGKYLKGQTNHKNGYVSFNITLPDGKKKRLYSHRLVALNYIENPHNKKEVNHKNGDKQNNCVDNLEWVTSKENKAHAIKTGLSNGLIGSANLMAIIDEGKARMIAAMIIWGYNDYYIANALCNGNVDIVRNIKSGKTWSHLFTENQLNLMRSKIRTHKIQDSDRHLICKYYQDNKNLYTGYGSVSKMAKDALLNIGYEINDTNFRIAKRLYYRYESPEITSLYNY